MRITASMLYDYIQCPHLVWRDRYGPLEEKNAEVNPFIELLWKKGALHEKNIVESMEDYVDLGEGSLEERLEKTLEHMEGGSGLIYQGVIAHGELLGIPDLLRRDESGKYIPIDIKSGMGLEGIDDDVGSGRPKKHYAVQLCLYIEILKNLGFAESSRGIVLNIEGEEVVYELDRPRGPRTPGTWFDLYEDIKTEVRLLSGNAAQNNPAMSGVCKLCRWCQSCTEWCEKKKDLSMVFFLGRGNRDVINRDLGITEVAALSEIRIEEVLERKKKDKSFLPGIGSGTLERIKRRAAILSNKSDPEIYEKIEFPDVKTEFFFDIEDDPTQDFVYLHGLYRREDGAENYADHFALGNTPAQEKAAWASFWEQMDKHDLSETSVYYYSSHEKSVYRRLRKKYPDVVTEERLEEFFSHPHVIDLYSIVLKNTDWPLSSYSVKAIAGYLGFKWRDKTPSGALSIQWFNDYLMTSDDAIFKRIIEYNEDDCKATMALKDGLKKISDRKFGQGNPCLRKG